MNKNTLLVILLITFGIVTLLALFMLTFVNHELKAYSKAAALSVNETEKSLEEFELLIKAETSDYSYYRDIAKGFLPSFNYHLVTSSRLAMKYNDYYWDIYSPAKDSMRIAIVKFIEVKDQESYEEALKSFNTEMQNYGLVVDYLEEIEMK